MYPMNKTCYFRLKAAWFVLLEKIRSAFIFFRNLFFSPLVQFLVHDRNRRKMSETLSLI